MKKMLIACAITSIFCLKGVAQKINDADVPPAVKTSFEKLFPGKTAKWEKEDGNYEAGLKKDDKRMSATFQPDGVFMESEIAIKESELPTLSR